MKLLKLLSKLPYVLDAIDTLYVNQRVLRNDVDRLHGAIAKIQQGSDYNVLDVSAHTRLDIHHKNLLSMAEAINKHVEAFALTEESEDGAG